MGFWSKLSEANPHKSVARGRELSNAYIESVISIPPEMADKAKICSICKAEIGGLFAKNLVPYLVIVDKAVKLSFDSSPLGIVVCSTCVNVFDIKESIT
jgi:hypothetical protein